ncbi:MAG: hypothetical protein AAF632_18620 [Bacteroidota bacterium]
MYVLWKKQYQAFYDQYSELVKCLRQNPHCPKTRYLNEHFRDLFKHLDVSRLTAQQQMSFEKTVRQMNELLEGGEEREPDEHAVTTVSVTTVAAATVDVARQYIDQPIAAKEKK